MKPISKKKLALSRATVRVLSGDQLRVAAGGAMDSFAYPCPTVEGCTGTCFCRPTDYPPCVPNSSVCATTLLSCQ